MDFSKRPDCPIHFLGMSVSNVHTNDGGTGGDQSFSASKTVLSHAYGNADFIGLLHGLKHGDIRLDGQKAMKNSHSPQGSHCVGHPRLGNRVHVRADQRNSESLCPKQKPMS